MAEREGFEPSVRLRAQRFSRPPRSTTPAPLRRGLPVERGADPTQSLLTPQLGEIAFFNAFEACFQGRKVPNIVEKQAKIGGFVPKPVDSGKWVRIFPPIRAGLARRFRFTEGRSCTQS